MKKACTSKDIQKEIGQILRNHRLERKVSLEALSAATRIRQQHLIAIEEDNKDPLLPQSYHRGYIKLYCEFLNIDSSEVLKHMADEQHPVTEQKSNFRLRRATKKVQTRSSRFKAKNLILSFFVGVGAIGAGYFGLIRNGVMSTLDTDHRLTVAENIDSTKSTLDSIIKID